jgi:peptidoglycan/xylan/chitin deacetylase (PgdA/CDA1 family)
MVIPPTVTKKIPILMYHSISSFASPRFRPNIVTPEAFEDQLTYLEESGYNSVTVSQFVQAMGKGGCTLPPRPVLLTFDDGYADFYTEALPALRCHGFIATLYVATGYVGGTSRWLRTIEETTRPMLTWTQLAEINANGIECGAHSHTHLPLDILPLDAADEEIVRSKKLLEEHLGQLVSSFAYPYGYYSDRVQQIVRETGFTSACAVRLAMSSLLDNPYALARLAIRPDTSVHALATALSTGRGPLVASPVERARFCLRFSMRRAYGELQRKRVAVKYVRRQD